MSYSHVVRLNLFVIILYVLSRLKDQNSYHRVKVHAYTVVKNIHVLLISFIHILYFVHIYIYIHDNTRVLIAII